MSERKNGDEKKAEKGKKGYLWHKAANSSKEKNNSHTYTTQAHTPAQTLIIFQLPPI